ncbi:MAG: sporulation protein YabP [Defluviitaleaceae bacterium]|nr:sporulation protein YabP [Defluviitaleaceae bacterium]
MSVISEVKRNERHRLVVDKRESVHISGVLDVISFDDGRVICETDLGVLILTGSNLHVRSLNLESGILEVLGQVVGINYEDEVAYVAGTRKKPSVFGKIFK